MTQRSLNQAVYQAGRSAIREYANLARETEGCISLTLGEPDFDTPANITEKVNEAFEHHETHYIKNNGTQQLLQEIADFENKQNGMHYSADQVIVTAGATEGIFLTLFSLLNPGDEVIVPMPAFGLYEQIIHLCRGTVVPLYTSEDDFQINPEKLNALITSKTKAVILNSPNNPTGCILNRSSMDAVHDAVNGKEIFVLCDDVYRQLSYESPVISFTEYEDLAEQIILIQSFSKPYAMTGWRMGYAVLPKEVKERAELVHQYMITSTPAPFQRACVEALHTDPSPFLKEYQKRREIILHGLSEIGMTYIKPQGAFYVFPSIEKYGLTSAEFCTRMIKEVKLAAVPGFCFDDDRCIRLSYCCSEENIREGLKRLQEFINILKEEGRG